MKTGLNFLLAILFSVPAFAQTRVVVLDTGLDINDSRLATHLCDGGHKDFTGTTLNDVNGHGTHVTGLIEQYAENSDYCLIIVKYYKEDSKNGNMKAYMEALQYSFGLNPDMINFSGSGPEFSEDERLEIVNHPGTILVAAAGNDGKDLDTTKFYPGCYNETNVITVGSIDWLTGHRSRFSNYGSYVHAWEVGEWVKSTLPGGKDGYMQGTSQAAAIRTGKMIKLMGTK